MTITTAKQALNPAFLKQKPERKEIELFKKEFISLLNRINEKETEEFHKNLMIDFLNSVYYKDNHYINTKGRADLVICNGKTPESPVGVLIEVKSPVNKTEMVSRENLNVKSFQELVLYYLRERKTSKNLELRYLIITNIYEWFVFDARNFEDIFGRNTKLEKQFTEFENKTSAAKTTDTFYKEIAAPAIEKALDKVEYTHFDIRDYNQILRNDDKEDDKKLVALYKFLSPI
ncbi:MAG: class I SAM-dependent DNA methyltransferase, partial [Prevotellaceae bacterium]|nr:class I SAM-dependent DNA methyltransferase [Prevotellaceae bacterium]